MAKLKLLGAAALLAGVIATPAMAQQAMQEPGAYRQAHPWGNDYNYGYGYGYGHPGFWPGDVAAGIVGGAIGTAEAIVTAPYRDSYAYYGEPRDYGDSYAYYGNRPARTTCGLQPGATYMGPDGRWYPC
jgi:CubicO group peptidase (beta-lactamase class C family)